MNVPFSTRVRGLRASGFFLITALLGFSGCATATRVALPPETRAQIPSSQLIVGLRHQEVATSVMKSQMSNAIGASGGAIGALIGGIADMSVENAQAKKAEAAAAPVRDALVGLDAGQTLTKAIYEELARLDWTKIKYAEPRSLTDDAKINSWVKGGAADLVFIADLDYRLSPNFDLIAISATITAHPNKNKALLSKAELKEPLPPLVFRNTFTTVVRPPGAGATGITFDENAKIWALNQGADVRVQMEAAFQEIARMVAFDLEQEGTPKNALYKAAPGAVTHTVPAVPTPVSGVVYAVGPNTNGYAVKDEGSRVWVRLPSGALFSLKK